MDQNLRDKGKIEIFQLGTDNLGKKWFIVLDIVGEVVSFDVVDEAHKDNKDYHEYSIVDRSGFRKRSKEIIIDDIVIKDEYQNRGIRTLVIKFIERWAKSRAIKKIYGKISEADSEHFKQLMQFYENLGFKFVLYKPQKRPFTGSVNKDI
jgi:GNAT superfamily N-acetyltransferase